MVKTGYISFITETGGGQDVDGNPIPSVKTNTEYVDCNLMVVKKEYKLFVEGQYQQAKYSCYIDSDIIGSLIVDLLPIDLETVKQIQLQDNNANDLGIFQVQNIEYLNLTKRVKIVV